MAEQVVVTSLAQLRYVLKLMRGHALEGEAREQAARELRADIYRHGLPAELQRILDAAPRID